MKLVVEVDETANIGQNLRRLGLVLAGQQDHEFVTANSRGRRRRIDSLVQNFTHPSQQRVTRGMSVRIVDGLEIIKVKDDKRQQVDTLSTQAIKLVDIERAVLQLRKHVVLAKVLEIGLGLLSSSDIGKSQKNQVPVFFVTGKNRKLHVYVQHVARQTAVANLPLLE